MLVQDQGKHGIKGAKHSGLVLLVEFLILEYIKESL